MSQQARRYTILNENERKEIVELYSDGENVNKIADAYKCGVATIYRIIKDSGVSRKQAANRQHKQKISKPVPEQFIFSYLRKREAHFYDGKYGSYVVYKNDSGEVTIRIGDKELSKEDLRVYIRELMDIYKEV